jgi:hypothetical protein
MMARALREAADCARLLLAHWFDFA